MTDNDIFDRIEVVERMIGYYSRKYDDMIGEYGVGVRPSWVSGDLAEISQSIQTYRAELADLQAELEATNANS
jgi:hypothetical protein